MRKLAMILLLGACTSAPEGDLCERHFEPYPDLIGQRVRTEQNAELLDAMEPYAEGDFAEAAKALQPYVDRHPREVEARFHLAVSLLGSGQPYDAELQLDFVEQDPRRVFRDETEWYSLLCLVCSGQRDRAVAGAKELAGRKDHRYSGAAARLLKDLEGA
ncbi:MAG: hypothetical protein H6596_06870 [Flavobacteriales bacterium]|nr:hypothetical protein [Flavobacteriales bacterium]MCB9200192.1 hypothetical protein [Flavobacteriales bacterium]